MEPPSAPKKSMDKYGGPTNQRTTLVTQLIGPPWYPNQFMEPLVPQPINGQIWDPNQSTYHSSDPTNRTTLVPQPMNGTPSAPTNQWTNMGSQPISVPL
jgi:hypothetical protein